METAIRSIKLLAVYLPLSASPMLVGISSLLPPRGSTTHPLCYTRSGAGWAGPPALRLADSKPGRPGLSEISAGTGLRPG